MNKPNPQPIDVAAYARRLACEANHIDAAGALNAVSVAAAALQKFRPEIEEFADPHAMGVQEVLDILHDMAGDIAGLDADRYGA